VSGTVAGAWQAVELTLTAEQDILDGYTSVDVWADFTGPDGTVLRRPAFYDGDRTWRLRFASPFAPASWTWTSHSDPEDPGLCRSGSVDIVAGAAPESVWRRHGFWRMSPSRRSLIHADGAPAILVGDTAWALPWRATLDQVRTYAVDRQAKGFNAVLLMSVQPDMRAVGPRERTADEGFDVGFEDLPSGHISRLNVEYFQYLDQIVDMLVEHDLVPVWSPVFQGYGWKGLGVAGLVVPPDEYARYCRYLVARYGAQPAVYLVGADGTGYEPQSAAGGAEVHSWDCYAQPTGIHYQPHGDNRAHQDAVWLDFQSCQTGHTGEHIPERVADMRRNVPPKGVTNGEPTYEHTRGEDNGHGWWQGHEAWSNLCAGGTMGVVYGAANVWQWKLHADEPGLEPYFSAPSGGWREALDLPGSRYVGLVGRILRGLPTTDMEPNWRVVSGPRALFVPGVLLISYQEFGGPLRLWRPDVDIPHQFTIFDPKTGREIASGDVAKDQALLDDDTRQPRVVIFAERLGHRRSGEL
jgi:hypothetical protein